MLNGFFTSSSRKESERPIDKLLETEDDYTPAKQTCEFLMKTRLRLQQSEQNKLRIKSVIERHIDKKGTADFENSKLVITERTLKSSAALPVEKKGRRKRGAPKKVEPLFNINNSNRVLLGSKRSVNAAGTVESNSSDSSDFMQKLLKVDEAPQHRRLLSQLNRFQKERASS